MRKVLATLFATAALSAGLIVPAVALEPPGCEPGSSNPCVPCEPGGAVPCKPEPCVDDSGRLLTAVVAQQATTIARQRERIERQHARILRLRHRLHNR